MQKVKMAKRGAISDLNHDNWDQEEKSEEAGEFSKASEDQLKGRVIKTARRRVAGSGGEPAATGASAFSGFKGFGKAAIPTAAASPFSFLSKITNASTNPESKDETDKVEPEKKETTFGGFAGFGKLVTPTASPFTATLPTEKPKETDQKSNEYYAKIKKLNLSVSTWIQTHVDKNPLCKLTPIFKDYEKYLLEIEAEEQKTGSKSDDQKMEPIKKTEISFGIDPKPAAIAEKPKIQSGFTFGGAITTPSSTTFNKPAFSFGSSAPMTFGNVTQTPASADEKKDNDADDEPPKVEFTPVEEKDSIFSKRCKLFVKQEGSYSDRGVGTLHIKKVEGKVQLIVRADTNLGHILLNIILNDSIPTQRMGKNNVMLICLPTPDSKPPPTSVLLRVKTSDEADDLLKTLEQYKK